MFKRGDIVEMDGILAAVVGTAEDRGAPEDHLALWFGEPQPKRISAGGRGGSQPEFLTVPIEYCKAARQATVKH